ncbi:hypothetical protein BJX65DRAFT_40762 [Aspergillus insuetus]
MASAILCVCYGPTKLWNICKTSLPLARPKNGASLDRRPKSRLTPKIPSGLSANSTPLRSTVLQPVGLWHFIASCMVLASQSMITETMFNVQSLLITEEELSRLNFENGIGSSPDAELGLMLGIYHKPGVYRFSRQQSMICITSKPSSLVESKVTPGFEALQSTVRCIIHDTTEY